jgi:hypothetical protein
VRGPVHARGAPSARYRGAIVEALFRASRGEPLPWAPVAPWVPALEELATTDETRTAARRGLRDLVAESMVDPDVFFAMAQFIQQGQLAGRAAYAGIGDSDPGEFGRAVAKLFAEQAIRLSPSLIEAYELLLTAQEREEVYQRFLAENPVFLDPLSSDVVPKQRLGLEYATDYAVRRLDGRWLLVEIEKPSDKIFTQNLDLTAEFTHAFGQVLDFQHWVDDNVAYAQKHMPGITAPRGLLVIGMRSSLDDRAMAKLRRFADNSERIDVFTFDDLLTGAQNLYRNIQGD